MVPFLLGILFGVGGVAVAVPLALGFLRDKDAKYVFFFFFFFFFLFFFLLSNKKHNQKKKKKEKSIT